MRVRKTVDNPDSQFVAMPQTITPAGIELNPQTEPIAEPANVNVDKTFTDNEININIESNNAKENDEELS